MKKNSITLMDFHFARFIEKLSGEKNPELALAAALVSHYTQKGHVCLDLANLAGEQLFTDGETKEPLFCPELSLWLEKLDNCRVVGKPGNFTPLIIDKHRLYLHRYRVYEEQVRDFILERMPIELKDTRYALLKSNLEHLFPSGKTTETDWQKIAALTSTVHKFCVISGGPGTGKTTTVVKILALLIQQNKDGKLRIALAAPTGKAAARLEESLAKEKDKLYCPDTVKELIPDKVSTLHRLLGPIPHSPYFQHDVKNPLLFDVLVVDEASLVDLPLMAKLTQALKPEVRVILLGDSNQLASVAPGAVLANICGIEFHKKTRADKPSYLQDCIVRLRKNYRFGGGSGIGILSEAVKEGRAEEALMILEGKYKDISWKDLSQGENLFCSLGEKILEGFRDYLKTTTTTNVFEHLEQFRILCALRRGPFGVTTINRLAEEVLTKSGLINPDKDWYRGRPIMIRRNDYNLNLFNGDVGVILPDATGKEPLRAFFPGSGKPFRKFLPQTLPEHETVFAMTVHKSQGSEFDKVLLLLPDIPSPILTRELIYTAITRARKSVEIWGTKKTFCQAVKNRVERASGLREALWEDKGNL